LVFVRFPGVAIAWYAVIKVRTKKARMMPLRHPPAPWGKKNAKVYSFAPFEQMKPFKESISSTSGRRCIQLGLGLTGKPARRMTAILGLQGGAVRRLRFGREKLIPTHGFYFIKL
jgi:hypothetical protein